MSVTTVGYVDKIEHNDDWYDVQDTLFRNTKGQVNGLAELGSDGKVPSTQLPTIPSAQIQSDYTQNDNTKVDYIKNKPTLGTAAALDVPSSGNASTSQVVKGNDTRLTDARNAADVSAWAKATTKPSYTASEVGLGNVDNTSDSTKKTNFTGSIASGNTGFVTGGDVYTGLSGKLDTSLKGAHNGLAELDSNGLVPSTQLPSYVDDVLNGTAQNVTETAAGTYSATGFILTGQSTPCTPEDGKTYVDTTSNIQYRWTGTVFVSMGSNITLGETNMTAYRGDRGKTAYDHATETKLGTATTSGFYKVAGTAQGHIASLTAVQKSDITGLGISATDENVKQSPSTDNAAYEVLFSGSSDNTEHTEGVKKSNKLTFNPSTGGLMNGDAAVASGAYSHAEGYKTTANEQYSHSEGYRTIANGKYSHAEGQSTTSSGQYSHAEGYNTSTKGNYSHAEGSGTSTKGSYSHAEGYGTIADAQWSHAEGYNTTADGLYSHAEGICTSAAGEGQLVIGQYNDPDDTSLFIIGNGSDTTARSNAMTVDATGNTIIYGNLRATNGANINGTVISGQDAIASGTNAHAEGNSTTASGENAHTEGYKTKAGANSAHAEGQQTIASNNNSHAEGYVTLAYGASAHAEGTQTIASENSSHAEGYGTTAGGASAHSEGYQTGVTSTAAHSEGYQTSANGQYSHAEGNKTTANGDSSHAEGVNTYANGAYSHTEGMKTSAYGTYAHAEGAYTCAFGNFSHTEGYSTKAAFYSHAEGGGTTAAGTTCHAEGSSTYVNGTSAHAEGRKTTAAGDYSHAEGMHTCAAGEGQHVSGKYNIPDTTSLFIIGNGTDTTALSNAMTVAANGDIQAGKYNGVDVAEVGEQLDTTSHTASGNPISFTTESAQNASNPTVTLEPIQSGSGTPSPTNVRPISGYDEINILGCGKNLVDISKVGSITLPDGNIRNGFEFEKLNGTYTISGDCNSNASIYFAYQTDGSTWSDSNSITTSVRARSFNVIGKLQIWAGTNQYIVNNVSNLQVEEGQIATTYEPYNKITDLSYDLPETVYSGTLDVESGVLTGIWKKIVFDGSSDEDWSVISAGSRGYYTHRIGVANAQPFDIAMVSNSFQGVSFNNRSYDASGICWIGGSGYSLQVIYNDYATAEAWKTYLASNPLEICYMVSDEIQLTPHQIKLLKDYNYISSSGSTISLTYRDGQFATLEELSESGVFDPYYVHTDNNYTTEEKTKLSLIDTLAISLDLTNHAIVVTQNV